MSTQDELGRILRERADQVTETPLSLSDVRGRARRIRRRRVAGVAGAAALVAAVALPIALLGGVGADKSDEPSPAPSPTRAVDPFPGGVPTLQDGVIIYQDGPRIPLDLDKGQVAGAFAALRDNRWVVRVQTDDGRRSAVVFSESGAPLATYAGADDLVATRDGTAVGWIGGDGTPMLLVSGADEPERLSKIDGADPVAIALTGDCTDHCAMWVRNAHGDDLGPTYRVSTDGAVTKAPVAAVVDVASGEGLIAGLDRMADDGIHTCGGLYDVRTHDLRWESCEANYYLLSPGGRLVAAQFAEGLGPNKVSLLDAKSGTSLAELSGSQVPSIAWEDDTHLLAVVVSPDGSTALDRLSANHLETVLDGFRTVEGANLPVILPVTG